MYIIPTCFELCTSYDWRVTAWKLSQTRFAFSFVRFLAFHAIIVWARHVWSGHTWRTERVRYMQARLQVASSPGSLIMWGREREPGIYCVAHAPNVYANLSRICRMFDTLWRFLTSPRNFWHHLRYASTWQPSTVQREIFQILIFFCNGCKTLSM